MDPTKTQQISLIQDWLKVDAEIIKLKKALKERNELKKQCTEKLTELMKSSNIDCLESGGKKFERSQKKYKKAITKKYLMATLNTFYSTTPEMVESLATHILEHREVVVKDELVVK